MKKLFVFLGVVLMTIGSAVKAQEVDSTVHLQKSSWGDAKTTDYIPDIALDTRFGYSQDFTNKTGRFGGNGLLLDINGKISPHFSYSLNHRIASFEGEDALGFGNTNWLLLTYETDWFSISAGKDALFVGNYEYDTYDLDSYWEMNSLFWNNIDPWQWGISAAWYPADGHSLSIQVTNSPFSEIEFGNLFAYALAWRGEWDYYQPYWSVNLWQFEPRNYVKAMNLGNRFSFGNFSFDIEYMTRAIDMKKFFSSDYTVIFAPSYEWDWGRAFAKCGWESISDDTLGYDFTGNNLFYGAGVEFFPFKEYKDLRIHAIWGSDTNYGKGHLLNIGLKWRMDFSKTAKLLFEKIKN